MTTDGPDFLVWLQPLPGDTPGVIRLRHFLKLALRAYRLKCLSVEEKGGLMAETSPLVAALAQRGALAADLRRLRNLIGG
jgi:hypothetical protein